MRVICAVCRRPVDRLVQHQDDLTSERVLRAECHGAVDIMRVSLAQLTGLTCAQADALDRAVGLAFDPERAPC